MHFLFTTHSSISSLSPSLFFFFSPSWMIIRGTSRPPRVVQSLLTVRKFSPWLGRQYLRIVSPWSWWIKWAECRGKGCNRLSEFGHSDTLCSSRKRAYSSCCSWVKAYLLVGEDFGTFAGFLLVSNTITHLLPPLPLFLEPLWREDKRLLASGIEALIFLEIADVEAILLQFLQVRHFEIEPLQMSPGVAIHSNIQVVLSLVNLSFTARTLTAQSKLPH